MKLEQWQKDFIEKVLSLTPEQRSRMIISSGRRNGKVLTYEQIKKALVFAKQYKHNQYTKAKRIMLRKNRGLKI